MEEAVGVECLRIGSVALEVALGDGRTLEQNLVVLPDLDFDALNGATYDPTVNGLPKWSQDTVARLSVRP